MKSLLNDLVNFYVVERNNLKLRVGDYFLTSFVDHEHGPFYITKLSSCAIEFLDLATGITVQHTMGSFEKHLKNDIYKISY